MKKILIFSTAYFPFVGGAEVAVKELTDRLGAVDPGAGDKYHFDMITARLSARLPKFEKIGNIHVYRLGIGWPKFDKYLLALGGRLLAGKLHNRNNYDAVWSIMASYGGLAAMFFKRKYHVPFILTLQEGDDLSYIAGRVKFFRGWFKKIFTGADVIQCISHYLAAWAKANGATGRIEVIPNGVDINKFRIKNYGLPRPPDRSIADLKAAAGLKNDDQVIITVSRLVEKNAVEDIIKAMLYLQDGNYKLLILGSGGAESRLKKLTADLSLNNRIIFLGMIRNEDVPEYLWASDIFVRPSLSEGLGNSFLEAMAAGLPVIGTPVGGIPDFLKDHETGLFCEPGNPASIAEKIRIISGDEELKNKLINNGRRLVEAEYDWDKIAVRLKNLFDNMLSGNNFLA